MLHINVIFSLNELSQDLKVSNGGSLNRKILVKINRCLFEIKALNFGRLVFNNKHSFEIQRKIRIDFLVTAGHFKTLASEQCWL